jgi:hypothetical protein
MEYLENQLRAFIERRRENKFMFGVVSALSPAMVPQPIRVHCHSSRPVPAHPINATESPAVMADFVIVRPALTVEEDGA